MKFIRCAVHAADAGNGGKNLQVGCVHGNTHTLGVRRKYIVPTSRTAQWFAGVCRLSVMQFSQVAERGARQQEQKHIILSRDNGIIKFRFSVGGASFRNNSMLRGTTSLQLKMTG